MHGAERAGVRAAEHGGVQGRGSLGPSAALDPVGPFATILLACLPSVHRLRRHRSAAGAPARVAAILHLLRCFIVLFAWVLHVHVLVRGPVLAESCFSKVLEEHGGKLESAADHGVHGVVLLLGGLVDVHGTDGGSEGEGGEGAHIVFDL